MQTVEPIDAQSLASRLDAGLLRVGEFSSVEIVRSSHASPTLLCLESFSDASGAPPFDCTPLPTPYVRFVDPPAAVAGVSLPRQYVRDCDDDACDRASARRVRLVDAAGHADDFVAVHGETPALLALGRSPALVEPGPVEPPRPVWFPTGTSPRSSGFDVYARIRDDDDHERAAFEDFIRRAAPFAPVCMPTFSGARGIPYVTRVPSNDAGLGVTWVHGPDPMDPRWVCVRTSAEAPTQCFAATDPGELVSYVVDEPTFAYALRAASRTVVALYWERLEEGGNGDGSGGAGDAHLVLFDAATGEPLGGLVVGSLTYENRLHDLGEHLGDDVSADCRAVVEGEILRRAPTTDDASPDDSFDPYDLVRHFERSVERDLLMPTAFDGAGFRLGARVHESVAADGSFMRLLDAPDVLAIALRNPACAATRRALRARRDEPDPDVGYDEDFGDDEEDAASGGAEAGDGAGEDAETRRRIGPRPSDETSRASALARPGRYVVTARGLERAR